MFLFGAVQQVSPFFAVLGLIVIMVPSGTWHKSVLCGPNFTPYILGNCPVFAATRRLDSRDLLARGYRPGHKPLNIVDYFYPAGPPLNRWARDLSVVLISYDTATHTVPPARGSGKQELEAKKKTSEEMHNILFVCTDVYLIC